MERGTYRGVPVFHEAVPGSQMVCLIFRVGMADEMLPERGLTHLVEHMALSDYDDPAVQVNGSVDSHMCRLVATGSKEGLWRFVDAMGEALAVTDPTAIRKERSVLAVEAQRSQSLIAQHHLRRYGANGMGAISFAEFGIRTVTPDVFDCWRSAHFGLSNAVIWSTTEPPGDDRPLLAECSHRPEIRPVEMMNRQGFFALETNALSFSAVVERSVSTVLGVELLRRRLERRIRKDEGLSYAVQALYERTASNQANMTITVDCEPSRSTRVFKEMRTEVASFLESGPLSTLLAAIVEEFDGQRDAVQAVFGLLDAAAHDYLMRGTILDADEIAQLQRSVTVESARAAMDPIADTAIWQITKHMSHVPQMQNLDAPDKISAFGTEHRYVNLYSPSDIGASLIVRAPATIALNDGPPSVEMDVGEVAAALCWGDGGRLLIDQAGRSLLVEPTRWQNGEKVCEFIDRAVPAGVRIERGFRFATPTTPAVPTNRVWLFLKKLAAIGGPFLIVLAAILAPTLTYRTIPIFFLAGALVIWIWLDTRVSHPTIYEDVRHRSQLEQYPPDLGPEVAARWGAPVLLWARAGGHLRSEVEQSEPDIWRELDTESISPEEAMWRLGGVLATDMFSETANEFLYDVLLRGRKSRRWAGVLCYVHVLDQTSISESVDLFMKTIGSGPLTAAASRLEANYVTWTRVRRRHRLIRYFVLNEYSVDRGTGTVLMRRWNQFRLGGFSRNE